MAKRDIVVLGASSGGLEVLTSLLGELPPELPGALLVTLHREPSSPGGLEGHLARRTPLAVRSPQEGEAIVPGTVYLAPPNRHLLVQEGAIVLSAAPRENRSRPAIDKLFRSAAVTYRSRTIGLVLSGQLDDGATGLAAIDTCGGLAAVQEPDTACFDEMPLSALRAVPRAARVPLDELPRWLSEHLGSEAPEPPAVPELLELEARFDRSGVEDPHLLRHGELTPISCPECGGPLRQLGSAEPLRLRCHVGHLYTEETQSAHQSHALEESMWAAIRSLREQARVLQSLGRRSGSASKATLEERAEQAEQHAQVLLELLRSRTVQDLHRPSPGSAGGGEAEAEAGAVLHNP